MDIGIYVCLISAGVGILYFLVNLVLYLKSGLFKTTWISTVSNKQIIQEIIWYCNDILYDKGIKHYPPFRLSHYKHRTYLGVFNNKGIVIYIKNNPDIQTLTNSVLHEINHYIQSQTEKKEYLRYEVYSKTLGYDKNPLEIECCHFADKWLKPCLRHLHNKNIIIRKTIWFNLNIT
jgi:Zn-dependent peptidase ImmA (M78 family)